MLVEALDYQLVLAPRTDADKRAKPEPLRFGLGFGSRSNPLLIGPGAALVILGLLDLLPNNPKRLFQKLGSLLAVRPLESHGVDGYFPNWGHDDFDGSVVHDYTP
jgi:hypothetical protein